MYSIAKQYPAFPTPSPRAWVAEGVCLLEPRVFGEKLVCFSCLDSSNAGGITIVEDVDSGRRYRVSVPDLKQGTAYQEKHELQFLGPA